MRGGYDEVVEVEESSVMSTPAAGSSGDLRTV